MPPQGFPPHPQGAFGPPRGLPPKKSRTGLWIALASTAVFVLLVGAGAEGESDVRTGVIARDANLYVHVTWAWSGGDFEPSVSEDAVLEAARAVFTAS
ncbi:hypothetical protein AB0I28_05875 [Phytomonospora sp. NPDC050363]|uniref:hypothetical protein n=1 Tax=Phytomonospora sp. NPDC050363 TaxID=3155642 RepID=UPI0033DA10A2